MKTSKCLMGVLLSSVLLIGSVFAANTLSQNVVNNLAVLKYASQEFTILLLNFSVISGL